MTNYLQAKYEALVLNDIPLPTAVKVNKYVTNHPDEFTRKELDDVTVVFKSLETGLRQGTIFPKDLHRALTRLGLNPTDQEIVDIANYIAKYEVQTSLPHCHTLTFSGTDSSTSRTSVTSSWESSGRRRGIEGRTSDRTCSRWLPVRL